VMTKKITRWLGAALTLLALAGGAGACSRSEAERTSSGDVERTRPTVVLATPAPGGQITRTGVNSVTRAAGYRLTAKNFDAFMTAVDSVGALARRDSTVRDYLAVGISNAGPANADAGLRWLRANAKVTGAIEGAGISVDDYYVASIAVVNAEHE